MTVRIDSDICIIGSGITAILAAESLPGNELNKQFSALRAVQGRVAASDVAAGA